MPADVTGRNPTDTPEGRQHLRQGANLHELARRRNQPNATVHVTMRGHAGTSGDRGGVCHPFILREPRKIQ